jgi:alkanesulfonate monooxygenase SsuD/methylene tetrahydromethanopterin reductase-like flavin-dependent oxidoreductase (luciferase family)
MRTLHRVGLAGAAAVGIDEPVGHRLRHYRHEGLLINAVPQGACGSSPSMPAVAGMDGDGFMLAPRGSAPTGRPHLVWRARRDSNPEKSSVSIRARRNSNPQPSDP